MNNNSLQKNLAFLGSPRKGGNSEVLLQAVLQGVAAGGGRAEVIRLCDLDINPCLNCGGCDETGECVLEDDMTPLYDKIMAARRIILASPIFFYGITAQAKAFIDRTQALWNRHRLWREQGQAPKHTGRKGFFVSVAATKGTRVFEGAALTMQYGYDAMGMQYGGDILIRGADKLGDMAKMTNELKHAEETGKKWILS
jgi:multimeric flavodoxin WrbA